MKSLSNNGDSGALIIDPAGNVGALLFGYIQGWCGPEKGVAGAVRCYEAEFGVVAPLDTLRRVLFHQMRLFAGSLGCAEPTRYTKLAERHTSHGVQKCPAPGTAISYNCRLWVPCWRSRYYPAGQYRVNFLCKGRQTLEEPHGSIVAHQDRL